MKNKLTDLKGVDTLKRFGEFKGMNYGNLHDEPKLCVGTVSTYIPCAHKNGWYHTVKFWIFKKKIFFCTDCNRFIEMTRKV